MEGGLSVRATLSFLEVLSSLGILDGEISVESVYDAALATFAPRIRPRGLRSAEEIVREVLDEVLLGKKVPRGLRIDLRPGNRDLSELLRDLMALSVAHRDLPNLKRQPSAGIFLQDLSALLEEKEKGNASRSYLPTLSEVLRNRFYQPAQLGIKTPSMVGNELLDALERFGLMRHDNAQGREGRHKFTQNSANLVGEETAREILGEYYDELVDKETSDQGATSYSLSREDLVKILSELQTLLDLQFRGRIPSLDWLIRSYPNQFPTLAEILERLSSTDSSPESQTLEQYANTSEALTRLLEALKQAGYLESEWRGLRLSVRAYELVFEDVLPEVERAVVYGEHESKRVGAGEGEIVDTRKYRPSDRFQDISMRATMRELVKHHRRNLERGDLRVNQSLPRKSLGITLVVDSSRSMASNGKLMYAKKTAVGLALAAAKKGDRVGVLAFSDYAREVSALTSRIDGFFLRRVAELRPLNSTNVEDALIKASDALTRQELEGQKHIIMVTDGVPTSCNDLLGVYPAQPFGFYYNPYFQRLSQQAALRQAERCRLRDITISAICIDRDQHVDREFCKQLSRIGNGRPYFLRNERDLLRTTLQEYNLVRNQ